MQDVFDVRQLVVTATRLLGDCDAMREHDLVVAILCVLYVLHILHAYRGILVFELSASRQIEIHGTEGGGGNVDVVDMVEDHWLVRVWQGQVFVAFFRC